MGRVAQLDKNFLVGQPIANPAQNKLIEVDRFFRFGPRARKKFLIRRAQTPAPAEICSNWPPRAPARKNFKV
jgi:hypothetical protein